MPTKAGAAKRGVCAKELADARVPLCQRRLSGKAVIGGLAERDDTVSDGRFKRDNREVLEQMQRADPAGLAIGRAEPRRPRIARPAQWVTVTSPCPKSPVDWSSVNASCAALSNSGKSRCLRKVETFGSMPLRWPLLRRNYARHAAPGHQAQGSRRALPDGVIAGERIRKRAESDNHALAREEAAVLEIEILRTAWHGERRGTRTFAQAVLSYLEAEPRSENYQARINRLLQAVGDVPLSAVNQQKAIELKAKMLQPDHAPGTYTRAIVMPMRAVLHYAHELGWCDPPHIIAPPENSGRTRFLCPQRPSVWSRLPLAICNHSWFSW
jgi:hypothetical protein